MSKSDEILLEVHYYSTVIGIPICVILIILLICQCRKRKRVYDEENSSDSGPDCKNKLKHYALLIMAFCAVIFAIVHQIMWLIALSDDITFSDALCPWIIWTSYICFIASFYFFCLFMLYRTKIVFRRPGPTQMSNITLYSFLIAIHCITLYKISILVHYEFVWFDSLSLCFPLLRDWMDLDTLLSLHKIRYWLDGVLIFALFLLFLRKLWMLKGQDPKLNALIRRTLIYAMMSSTTTLIITVGRLFELQTQELLTIDMVFNCICIVFSYKMDFKCLKCIDWSWMENIILFHSANDDGDGDVELDQADNDEQADNSQAPAQECKVMSTSQTSVPSSQ